MRASALGRAEISTGSHTSSAFGEDSAAGWRTTTAALADTSVLIDLLRGLPAAHELIRGERQASEPVFATVLTRVEIIGGMLQREEATTAALFSTIRWIEVTNEIADRAASYARRFARSHRAIDVVDYVIAATRDDLDVPLWTLNVKHFPMFRGLQPPYAR